MSGSGRLLSRYIEGSVERNCGGAGFKTFRVMGEGTNIDFLDPFIQVDEIKRRFQQRDATPLPWTPYVGMTRLYYIIAGGILWTGRHPSKGDKQGETHKGDVFALHARSGALIEETASAAIYTKGGLLHAFEIWVKEPECFSHSDPLIDNYSSRELPKSEGDGWTAKVIYGTFAIDGTETPAVETTSPCNIIDFAIFGGKTIEYEVPEEWNAAVYVYEGEAELQSNMQIVGEGSMAIYERKGTTIEIWAKGGEAGAITRCLLFCGKPLREAMERSGTTIASWANEIDKIKMSEDFRDAFHNIEMLKAEPNEQGVRVSCDDVQTPRLPSGNCGFETFRNIVSKPSDALKEQDLKARIDNLTALKQKGTPGLELAIASTRKELKEYQASRKSSAQPSKPGQLETNLDQEMAQYEAQWKQYSTKWTAYLQQLHGKIHTTPNDLSLREQYKTKHAEYSKQLELYNKKVSIYNHNKAQQKQAAAAKQEIHGVGRPQGRLDLVLEDN